MRRLYSQILFLTMLFSLSACGGYGSSFSCKDASGLHCLPLSAVDKQIDSREIVEVELKDKAKCKGKNCHVKSHTDKPDIKPSKFNRVKLQQATEQREFREADVLYIK